MSVSLGKKKSSSSFDRSPYFTDTGFSRIDGRSIRLDPSIRGIQDETRQRLAGLYGDVGNAADRFLNQSSDLRGRFLGNTGALVEARARPVREQFQTLRDQTQQSLGRRGVGGSSFGIQSLRDITERGAQAEGDARAQALNEVFQFEAGLNAQELDALNNAAAQRAAITGEDLNIAKMRLYQELGIFGLGQRGSGSESTTGIGAEFDVFKKGLPLIG